MNKTITLLTLTLLLSSQTSFAQPMERKLPKNSKGQFKVSQPVATDAVSTAFAVPTARPRRTELPRWEFRTAPVPFIAQWYTLDVSFHPTENWAFGPAAVFYNSQPIGNMFLPSYRGYAAGLSANYYFKSVVRHSWYVSTHAFYENFLSYRHAYTDYFENEGFRGNLAFGYRWNWSAFNMMVGVGGELRSHTRTNKFDLADERTPDNRLDYGGGPKTEQETRALPHIEFKIGIQI